MATRRPVISRPRTSTLPNIQNAISSTQPRSRQTIPKSISTNRLTNSTADNQDSESNIRVVIRSRRRSPREIQETSPIILSSDGPKSHQITVETSTPISSLGVVTLPPTRTYPFDLVFGPEADQAMVYNDVVNPMLEEVMQGYNCTLFAYGQTGTGKTYTMQGDLSPTPMGNPSSQAGMIPRVLFRLFHQLETTATDYSVKISFVELYNEELRDLLAPELSAPAGSSQPMGKGSNPNPNNTAAEGGLKIFDDASKKGVFIQNLEETLVKNSKDALALLTKGSHRRQIAATKFNDHSSRSHSVFSITVHIKETSSVGDDLLKVGKLNLVDLAGSENIGRSGAENKRAREAGMINQSLLTLGRVINALVDRSSHVPYRESKLTRLLQDSLGGRTKTCIIATVSPARSNMEETLSTLDYAMRAKSIRNKPELNARMTRNALLKEYVVEIERLKADVLAAREKNGIFFSEETWGQLSAEQELQRTEWEEARRQVEFVESQMRSVREEFEMSVGLLMKRDGEIRQMGELLREREGELEEREGELRVVREELEEEVVLREAYQGNEGVLDGIAGGLKKVVGESISDVEGLFEKLQRKTSVFTSNTKAVSTYSQSIAANITALSTKLEDFIEASNQSTTKLRTEAKQYQTKELQILADQSERIDGQLHRVQDALKIIQAKETVSNEAVGAIQAAVKEAQENFKSGFAVWSEGLGKSCEVICKELQSAAVDDLGSVEKALKAMGSLVDTIVHDAREYVTSERESVLQAKALASTAANAEIARLREQNILLTKLLESEKAKAERAKDELIQRVSGLLGEFTSARDRSLREVVSSVQADNTKAEAEMQQFGTKHGEAMDGLVKRGDESGVSMERRGTEGKRTRDGALKTLTSAKATFKDGVSNLQSSVSNSMSTYSSEVQKHSQTLIGTCSSAFDRHGRSKRARIEATNSMAADVQSEYRHVQQSIASTSKNVEGFAGRVTSEGAGLADVTTAYNEAATVDLASIQQSTRALAVQGMREDTPTGLTPRKRVWQYVDQWGLTQSRDTVLNARRQQDASNDNLVDKNLPLQADAEEDDNVEGEDVEEVEASLRLFGDYSPSLPGPGDFTSLLHPRAIAVGAAASSPMQSESGLGVLGPESPGAVSMVSSGLSTSIPIPQPAGKKMTNGIKSGLPTLGTLTDRPTNVLPHHASRRVR